jgi:hypothetical protein
MKYLIANIKSEKIGTNIKTISNKKEYGKISKQRIRIEKHFFLWGLSDISVPVSNFGF